MFFFIDYKQQTIMAFSKKGAAARHGLEIMGVEVSRKADPVALFLKHEGENYEIKNLESAFAWVAESEDPPRLALILKNATGEFYGN